MINFYLSLIGDHQYDSKFERIYNTYEKRLFDFSYGIVKDHYGAEEVLQDTFMKIAGMIEDIEEDEKMLKPFLYKITKNLSYNYLKRQKKHHGVLSLECYTENCDDCSDPYKETASNESTNQIIEKIYNLPEIYKDVCVLYFLYELSMPRIASILGINTNTVHTRIRRGKAKIIKIIEEAKKSE